MNEPIPPNRFSLAEIIDQVLSFYKKTIFIRADKFNLNNIPARGTTIKDFPGLNETPGCDGILDWKFTFAEPHRTDGWHAFNFVKPFTTEESAVPVLTYKVTKPASWPAVLGSLILRALDEGSYECVGGVITDTRDYSTSPGLAAVDVKWAKDAYDGPTDFEYTMYLKNEPFTITSVGATKPYPRSLHFDRHIVSASLPPHLRPSTILPIISITVPGYGTIDYPAINFGATNQTAWVDHIIMNEQSAAPGGLWKREQWKILAPDV